MKRSIMPLVATLTLSGCLLGPDFSDPVVAVPVAYRSDDGLPLTENTLDSQWWQTFGDPQISEMVRQAAENNRDIRLATARLKKAMAAVGISEASLFPVLDLTLSAERERLSKTDAEPIREVANPQNSREAYLAASWEIDLFGKIRRLTESARADARAMNQARRAVLMSVTANLITQYINLLALDAQLAIARQTADAYRQALELAKRQFAHGLVSDMNVSQAASQYRLAKARVPVLENSIVKTENAINILLGRNPQPVLRGSTLDRLTEPPVPGDLPSRLLERRPDILEAHENLVSANAKIGAALAAYFPSFSLTGNLGVSTAELKNLSAGQSGIWNLAGLVSLPVFSGGAITAQLSQAKAGYEAGLAQYESTVISAFSDVDNALSYRMSVRSHRDEQQVAVENLSRYARLAAMQYEEGYSGYDVVLQSNESLLNARLDLVQLQADSLTSVVGIYRALGGGWIDQVNADQSVALKQDTPHLGPVGKEREICSKIAVLVVR